MLAGVKYKFYISRIHTILQQRSVIKPNCTTARNCTIWIKVTQIHPGNICKNTASLSQHWTCDYVFLRWRSHEPTLSGEWVQRLQILQNRPSLGRPQQMLHPHIQQNMRSGNRKEKKIHRPNTDSKMLTTISGASIFILLYILRLSIKETTNVHSF